MVSVTQREIYQRKEQDMTSAKGAATIYPQYNTSIKYTKKMIQITNN